MRVMATYIDRVNCFVSVKLHELIYIIRITVACIHMRVFYISVIRIIYIGSYNLYIDCTNLYKYCMDLHRLQQLMLVIIIHRSDTIYITCRDSCELV